MFISRVDATKAGMRRVMVIFSFSSRQYVCSMYAVCMQYAHSMHTVCSMYESMLFIIFLNFSLPSISCRF